MQGRYCLPDRCDGDGANRKPAGDQQTAPGQGSLCILISALFGGYGRLSIAWCAFGRVCGSWCLTVRITLDAFLVRRRQDHLAATPQCSCDVAAMDAEVDQNRAHDDECNRVVGRHEGKLPRIVLGVIQHPGRELQDHGAD